MLMRSLTSISGITLNKLHFEQTPNLPFTPRPEKTRTENLHSPDKFKRATDDGEPCSPGGRAALQERLRNVERDIEAYTQFDRSEKDRFNRESYLWTAEDRIEWQETQLGNAERLRELLRERGDLQNRIERRGA